VVSETFKRFLALSSDFCQVQEAYGIIKWFMVLSNGFCHFLVVSGTHKLLNQFKVTSGSVKLLLSLLSDFYNFQVVFVIFKYFLELLKVPSDTIRWLMALSSDFYQFQ